MIGGLLKTVLWLGCIVFIVGAVLRLFFVEIAEVGHNGMAPTLIAGDKVVLWREAAVGLGDPVICQHPRRPGKHVLGRVVAKAGQTVGTDGRGQLKIGNRIHSVDWKDKLVFRDTLLRKNITMQRGVIRLANRNYEFAIREGDVLQMDPVTVRKGVFLLGDNRSSPGNDSRSFGEVDPATCTGQVFLRLRPAEPRGDDIDHGWLDMIW